MLILYRFLINLICFFAPLILWIRIFKQKEDRKRFKEKLCIIKKTRPNGKLVWFHASSVGELLSVIPLAEKIGKRNDIKTILFTTNTLSSSKIFHKKKKIKKAIHQFLPIDTDKFSKKFIDYWNPSLVFFVESEIWPNFILNIKKKNIPLILINGRITHKTYLNWKKVLGFAKKIFNKFDICLTQNKETKRFLKYFNAEKIKDLGNLKFSKAKSFAPIKINKKIKNLLKKNIWCASSTHFNEEELCGKVHIKLKKKIKNLVTIIIPRHVHRTDEIVEKLNHMNLKVQKHSNANKFENNKDIYFVDSYGETLNFYNISKIVFLGGSFIKHGGQNPIEPARLGCKILHGPHIENFKEVYKYLNSVGLSSKTNNIKDLTKYLAYEFKKSSKKNYKYKKQIDYIGQQILNKTFFEIQKYL